MEMESRTFKIVAAALGGCILFASLAAVAVVLFSSADSRPAAKSVPTISDAKAEPKKERVPVYSFFSQLDGRAVSTSADTVPNIITAMIDNHADARPQAGLASAPFVYEMPVEGSITRYMAVFPLAADMPRLGPIRSARPYFITAAREFGNPLYLHSGGSPEALTLLKTGVIRDVNEFYWGSYFKRDAQEAAPHNLFTSSSAWQRIDEKMTTSYGSEYQAASWSGWRFQRYGDDEEYAKLTLSATPTQAISSAALKYASNYTVGWTYDPATLLYYRTLQGVPSTDAGAQPILATTIIVQQAAVKSLDSEDRKSVALVGSGKGWVMSRGLMARATWKKASPTERTRWYDDAGEEFVFVPGIVWVEVVPLTLAPAFH